LLTGNTITDPTTDFIGTTDNEPLEIHVFGARVLRLEPGGVSAHASSQGYADGTGAPNIIAGSESNSIVYSFTVGATISGGGATNYEGGPLVNSVVGDFGVVGGGGQNTSGYYSAVGGGYGNLANGSYGYGTVSGGIFNEADDYGAVGGGQDNEAQGTHATVSGGEFNIAYGDHVTIGGGYQNHVHDAFSAVGGGQYNTANAGATVGGGENNQATGTDAIVPGGNQNLASGQFSFAAGQQAQAVNDGSFVWADSQDAVFSSTAADQFSVRAVGGFVFVTAIDMSGTPTAGATLNPGDTSWSSISDRNAKKNFVPVSGEAILAKLAAIPISKWNYKWEADTNTPHIGPMAQDFKAAFFPGRDDKKISTLEFDGVELAAIQGLNQKLEDRSEKLEAENAELKARLEKLEQLLTGKGGGAK
jgi:hypothetical protein